MTQRNDLQYITGGEQYGKHRAIPQGYTKSYGSYITIL